VVGILRFTFFLSTIVGDFGVTMTTRRFDGKVVLATGAASGIGLVTARAFAAEGARVVIADLAEERAAEKAEEIRQGGGVAASFGVDVTDYAACEDMVAYTVKTFGALHVAFNNAGIAGSINPDFEDCSVEQWDRSISINLNGIFYCMKAETPALRASAGTAIVNTASAASFIARPGMPAYIASKHGVAGLTKAAALDLIKYGIRVNAVCPGVVDTPFLADTFGAPEVRKVMEGYVPVGRFADPGEIARSVLFLASDEASYIVGSLVRVDGGMTLP